MIAVDSFMWRTTDAMTLYWRETDLGTITDMWGDQPWVSGKFSPSQAAIKFRDFFDACVNEDSPQPNIEELFEAALLVEENWYIVSQNGVRFDISLPAVHWDSGDITWRWR